MKSLSKLLVSFVLIVLASQANALTNAYFDNNSNATVYVKLTLLYPDDFKCRFTYSTASNNDHNMKLTPYLHPIIGPFPSDCHISVSASLDNQHFTMCKGGENIVEGYTAAINVNGSSVSCEVLPWNSANRH